jgi:opacity protein-like surface antigen
MGQSSLKYHWYINTNGGLSQLYGDIQNENNPFGKLSDETGVGYGVRVGKYLGPVFTAHLQFLKADLLGKSNSDDLKFSSDFMEYQLGTTVNFTHLFFGKKERRFNIYGTTGIAAIFFRSESRNISTGNLVDDFGYTNDPDREKSSRESALSFPLGAGLDVKLADRWYLNLESVWRFSTSDHLDAKASAPKKDAYYYTSLGLSFNFLGKKSKEAIEKPDKKTEIAIDPYANEKVFLVYNIPGDLKSLGEFDMRCEIHKGKIDGPGTLTQILPIGFNVMDTVIGDATVKFKNYTLFLQWDELPKDSVFEVSYTVKLDRIYGNLPLVSNLYLGRTGKEYKFRTSAFIERVEEVVVSEEPVPEILKKDTLSTFKKVEFRIQVRAAYKAKIPLQNLANKYNLREDIKEDYVGNWYKYSIGSFGSYEEAKEYRSAIIGEHGVRDAFIVAFYQGKRLNELSELKELAPEAYPYKTKFKEEGPCYRVQILALMKSSVETEALKDIYKIEEDVNEEVFYNWRKYTVGKCTSIGEAKLLLTKMKDKGISDAFIVIYKNGERVLAK